VQHRDLDLQPLRDRLDAVVEHRVAAEPEHALAPVEREADHVADDRVAERRAVAARGGRDLDRG
jgi:hypothetical protein